MALISIKLCYPCYKTIISLSSLPDLAEDVGGREFVEDVELIEASKAHWSLYRTFGLTSDCPRTDEITLGSSVNFEFAKHWGTK